MKGGDGWRRREWRGRRDGGGGDSGGGECGGGGGETVEKERVKGEEIVVQTRCVY